MRPSMWLNFLLLTFALDTSAFAAPAEWLVIPSPGVSTQLISEFRGRIEIIRSEAVFDSGEIAYLLSIQGGAQIARTLKITIQNSQSLEVLKSWSHQNGDAFTFEENSSVSLDGMGQKENDPLYDPLYKEQWALENKGLEFVLKTSDIDGIRFQGVAGEDTGIRGLPAENSQNPIIVAVLDTGIDPRHPDLKNQILRKEDECQAWDSYQACLKTKRNEDLCNREWGKTDTDRNGYPMDCQGWNILGAVDRQTGVRGNNQILDDVGHGTHVSGIIAAGKNTIGVQGISRAVKILPVKILREAVPEPARPLDDEVAPATPIENQLPKLVSFADLFSRGFLYALRSGARVINMSLGWPRNADSLFMRTLVKIAQNQGVLIVASAGNDSSPNPVYPCLYEGVVCVASHGPDGALSKFSSYGSGVDIAAPGFMILSTWLTQCDNPNCRQKYFTERLGYDFRNGTSMSAPYVAGALARLLNAGWSADESYARLMAGSRPIRSSSIDPSASQKWIRNGNMDLKRSFEATPRPWIVAKKKEVLFLGWDRKSHKLESKLELKNYWDPARQVRFEIKLSDNSSARGFTLDQNSVEMGAWASGETKKLPIHLTIASKNVSSEIEIEIAPIADELRLPTLKIQAEIIVLLNEDFEDGQIKINTIDPSAASQLRGATIQTVLSAQTDVMDQNPSYLAVKTSKTQTQLSLLSPVVEQHRFKVVATNTLPSALTSVLGIYQTESGYILASQAQEVRKGARISLLRWIYLTPELQPIEGQDWTYDGEIGGVPNSIRWLLIGDRRLPAWIADGTLPAAELPTPTPWNKTLANPVDRRLYYFNESGIHTITLPADTFPAEFLSSKDLLLAKGIGFDREFWTGQLQPDLSWTEVTKFDFAQFHMIGGISPTAVWSLDRPGLVVGTAFGSQTLRGKNQISLLRNDSTQVDQYLVTPSDSLSSIHRIAAVFVDSQHPGMLGFGQSLYRLEYFDSFHSLSAYTSLKRYGFMTKSLFDRFYYPMTVSNTPAVYVPAGLGVSLSAEVIMPIADPHNSQTVCLDRPAKFRIFPTGNCNALNPTPQNLVYFCGDKIIQVPLEIDIFKQ